MSRPISILTAVILFFSGCTDLGNPEDPFLDSDSPVAPRNASTAYSTRDGTSITVHPSGVVFAIPVEWVKWHYQHRDNLHLSGTALAGVKDADQNEWDPEFARVCNAALPFDRCAAHVGGEGWGAQGHSFGDIQLRVYDFLDSPSNLEERIVKGAPRGARVAEIKRESDGVWSRVLVCYRDDSSGRFKPGT